MTAAHDDLRASFAIACEAAALVQCDLDDVDKEILEANDYGASWDQRAALYEREAVLARQRADVVQRVAQLAQGMAGVETMKEDLRTQVDP